VSFLNNPEMCT